MRGTLHAATLAGLAAIVLLAGCATAAPTPTSMPGVTAGVRPGSQSASPSASATALLAASPRSGAPGQAGATGAVDPTPVAAPATPTPAVPTTASPLVARVVSFPDVFAAPIPADLLVYEDGLVLTPGWRSPGMEGFRYVERRLSPDGMALVRTAFAEAVGAGGEVGGTVPAEKQAGYATYEVTVDAGKGPVTARTLNVRSGADAAALVRFAERWWTPAQALDPAAWEDAAPRPYAADRFAVYAWLAPDCCRTAGAPDAALAEVVLGPFAAMPPAPDPASGAARCTVIDGPTRAALAAAVGGGRLGDGWDRADAELNWGSGSVALTVVPMLPGTGACPGQRD